MTSNPAASRKAWSICAAILAALVCLRAAPCAAADKTDVVELVNGDRITCEIRKLERGKVTVKTDGIGTISIEWDDVTAVTSPTTFDVELDSGQRYFGTLGKSDARTLAVGTASGPVQLVMVSVVRISPVTGSFWRRLDGSIDAGFNFTQANVQTQWTFDSTVSYRSQHWLSTLSGDSALTIQESADRQIRNAISLQVQRFLAPRWSAVGFSQFQQNEELSLNLRAVIGGGIQRVIRQSNRSVISGIAAAAFTREQYEGAETDRVAEAVVAGAWDWFTFDGRSTNLHIAAGSFFALNGDPRTRVEMNTSFKSDIVGDLYWSINMFESYNSKPPAEQKTNDFGVSAAMGWSF